MFNVEEKYRVGDMVMVYKADGECYKPAEEYTDYFQKPRKWKIADKFSRNDRDIRLIAKTDLGPIEMYLNYMRVATGLYKLEKV